MKVGMNLLLWTGHVTQEHLPVLRALKQTGFDGVEVPLFDPSDPAHYRRLGEVLDDLGPERTAVPLVPDAAHTPTPPDAAARPAWRDWGGAPTTAEAQSLSPDWKGAKDRSAATAWRRSSPMGAIAYARRSNERPAL